MTCTVAIICTILALSPVFAEVTRSEATEGAERVVTLENEHLRLVIFPDLGGRIGHIIDRATGEDLVYWDLGEEAVYAGLGGALDDRVNTFEQYNAVLPEDAPGSVTLSYQEEKARIEKTITLDDGASTIRVDYTFANTSQEDFGDYEAMVKNFFLPSAAPVTEDDLYCIPTSGGVREIAARTGSWNYPELRGKFKQDVGPWNAFVSTTKRRAIATAFSNDFYRWFYYWKGGIDYPTYEWVFQALPAGMQGSTTLWMHVARDIPAVSHADGAVVAHTQHTDAGLATSVFAASEALQGATLQTTVRRLPGEGEETLAAVDLPAIAHAQTGSVSVPWQAADGTWVVHQRIMRGGETVSEWEQAVVVGEPSGDYAREVQFPAVAQLEPVPGWERIAETDLVQPTQEDVERGFVIYLDEFAAEGQAGRSLRSYAMDMGQGEAKTFGMRVRALRDLQNLAISVASDRLPEGQIEVFGVELVDVSNESSGMSNRIGRKLVLWPMTDLAEGEEAEVWVRARTTEAERGQLPVTLTARARGTDSATVDLTLNVRAVALPRPSLISQEAEHQLMGLPGCWDAEAAAWNEEVLERYAADLGDHLVDFEQGFWGWFTYSRHPDQVLLEDGRTLREWKASSPADTDRPRMDLSYLNPLFDAAIRHGLVRFSTNASGGLPPAHVEGVLMAEIARYLRDRGYPGADLWCKYKDEQPATTYPSMADEVRWAVENGWRPFTTVHNLLAKPGHLSILNPRFDMFQGAFSTLDDLQARLDDGTLEPDDEIWMYQGWGATWREYTDNRRPGWFSAAALLDGYHVHVYYRWSMTDAVIFPSESGPSSSPAWEAMRDGMADAQWVTLARRWIERLERASAEDARLQPVVADARERLASAIGGEDALVPLSKMRDRLLWVDRIDPTQFTLPRAEQARAIVLDLLEDLRPQVKALGPSLYYDGQTLAEEGDVRVRITSGSSDAVDLMSTLLEDRFGVEPRTGRAWAGDFAVDLRVGDTSGWEDADLHIWEGYPGAGEYIIHIEDATEEQPARMLIYAPDQAGLEKGIRNWVQFLRSERPGAAR